MPVFDIDLVYLWADGSDQEWLAKKNRFLGREVDLNTEATSKARNTDNGELKFSLRSVEQNAPWIRNIYVVTDEQRPAWLNLEHEKICLIDIRQLLPVEALPCYNSVIIEHYLWKIPGLAEHFLYANDDMFIYKPVTPHFFFTSDGLPIVRLQRVFTGKWGFNLRRLLHIHTNIYRKTIDRAARLVEQQYGRYIASVPHHNIDAYLKSDYREASLEVYAEAIMATLPHHIRSEKDIQRILYLYHALSVKRGVLRYADRRESCRIRLHKPDFMHFIKRYDPVLFCLNDSHHASDADRARVEPFLNELFPDPSSFEKQL
jgi:hypothetical protein